jgi:hypothetical protein
MHDRICHASLTRAAVAAVVPLALPLALLLAVTAVFAAEASPDVVVRGESADDDFGWAVAGAGDVNGDAIPDLLVGAPANDFIDDFAGRAYVFLGPLSPNMNAGVADATISAEAFGDNLGVAVAGGFDTDDDGHDDILVGARGNDTPGIQAGRVYLFRGPLAGDHGATSADAIISGTEYSELGRAVAAGSLDDDGFDEVIVGAPDADGLGAISGEVYVFNGPVQGALGAGDADATLSGVLLNELVGSSIAIGDLDDDGTGDLVVGGPRPPLNGTDTGRVYVFHGPVQGTLSVLQADAVLYGEATNDAFGSSVDAGRDVDGDGVEDLVVGASQLFNPGAGKAYLFLGPLDGSIQATDADAVFVGEAEDDVFGDSVALVPDTDGDGRAEVLVGAWNNAAGGQRAGRAYLFRGGSLAGTIAAGQADLFLTGGPSPDQVGLSVAGDDLDGSGLGDLIIGAPQFAEGDRGLTYVVYDPVATTGLEPADRPRAPRARLALHVASPTRTPVELTYELPVAVGAARLEVHDVSGRLLLTRHLGGGTPGGHRLVWDGADRDGRSVASGVYFLRVAAGGAEAVAKVVIAE